MREWNISDPKKYYRQNNNEIHPNIRCKPTMIVEGLDLAKWDLPSGKFKQPEDNLTYFMEQNYGKDAPENWELIVRAINEHFLPGSNAIINLRYNWLIREALFGITQGIPFVASTWLTKAGHVVNIVGFTTDDESIPLKWDDIMFSSIREIIIDDPYGDRTSGKYDTRKSGFNNRYPRDEFMKYWRSTGVQVRRKK